MEILERSSIRLVADIRSNPASPRNAHFERNALANTLEKRGLVYRWFRQLGGRRPFTPNSKEHTALREEGSRRYAEAMNTDVFTDAVKDLMGLSASTVVVVMGTERDYRKCHRSLLADKLQSMGAEVVHIIDVEEATEHGLHPDLVVVKNKLSYRSKQLSLLEHKGAENEST
jgi:uncharacterized protein (DUF488 family)